jgi:hypothetical protein
MSPISTVRLPASSVHSTLAPVTAVIVWDHLADPSCPVG